MVIQSILLHWNKEINSATFEKTLQLSHPHRSNGYHTKIPRDLDLLQLYTLPETNIAPENRPPQ